MVTGFKTNDGVLYWVDPLGGTHRYALEPGYRTGAVAARQACVYIAGPQARAVKAASMRVSLTCLEGGALVDCHDAEHLARVWTRGDVAGVSIIDDVSRVATGGAPGQRHASIGLYPFEQLMSHQGLENRLGAPIVKLYGSTADLVGDGFPWSHIAFHERRIKPPAPKP